MAHTGAVAGSVEACDAALAASGAIQVFTLDELHRDGGAGVADQDAADRAQHRRTVPLRRRDRARAGRRRGERHRLRAAGRSRGEDQAADARVLAPQQSARPHLGRACTTPRWPSTARRRWASSTKSARWCWCRTRPRAWARSRPRATPRCSPPSRAAPKRPASRSSPSPTSRTSRIPSSPASRARPARPTCAARVKALPRSRGMRSWASRASEACAHHSRTRAKRNPRKKLL